MKTIAYFLGEFPRLSNTFINNEIAELSQRGYRLKIYALNRVDGGDFDQLMNTEKDVCYIKENTSFVRVVGSHFFYLFTKPGAYFKLLGDALKRKLPFVIFLKFLWVVRDIQQLDFDILYGHFAQGQNTIARMASVILKKPYAVKIHGSDILIWNHYEQEYMIRDAKCCLVVSNMLSDYLLEHYPIKKDRVVVHPCGIYLDKFQNEDKKFEENIILCVGRQVRTKGIEYLIRAAKFLANRQLQFQLQIVGDGEDIEEFKHLTKEMELESFVKFVGSVPNSELIEYYKKAYVFVLPSLCEGTPMVLMEAMAAGLPVITTPVGGIIDMVEDGANGFIVEPQNPKMLALRIAELLMDPDKAKAMGEKGMVKANDYDIHQQTDRLVDIIETL